MKMDMLLGLGFCFCFAVGNTQTPVASTIPTERQQLAKKGLFESDDILHITLKGNVHDLLNNRSGEARDFPMILSYSGEDSTVISIPVKVKTRGHFRRLKENCLYPPLLIQFNENNEQSSSYFSGQPKLKLGMPCQGEEYVVHEWLVYKLYNLLSPQSFRARLLRVTLEDPKNKKAVSPFYGILLEDEHQMAKRNNSVLVKRKIRSQQTVQGPFLRMATFEYLIGNTDWSVEYLQNIHLIATDSLSVPVTVPYDFDLSGIVNAPYALPAEELEMRSVRERRYRGYCVQDMKIFDSTIVYYNQMKKDIYDIFTGCPLLEAKYIRTTVQFLDEFYSTINNPKSLQRDFGYPCDKNGTGNVIIKGLKGE